ncbi:MAG: YihA family ribosome biogenesis GTP-binding protein [Burkholderiales bacterium]|nr:YihA family ribosome biogenesis GTP-binding protein [Burkholderiales bacterium]
MTLFRSAAFVQSAHNLRDLPPAGPPEVAFAGRSNAGKSSVINTLVHRTRLAFVSKTPGRTQLINFYRIAHGALLVDLPGYGFARVPETLRRHWGTVLSEYLQTRRSLCGLVIVMDIRHPLTSLDQNMLGWFRPTGKPVHVLLTKADKLSRSAADTVLRGVRARLRVLAPTATVQLFSALKRTGVEEVERTLAEWFGLPLESIAEADLRGRTDDHGARRKAPKQPGLERQEATLGPPEQKSPELKGKARGETP